MTIFASPHNDDETLFGAFTLLRERPLVVVVYDSHLQEKRGFPVTAKQRRLETETACSILGCQARFLGFRDDDPTVTAEGIWRRLYAIGADAVYAPAFENGGHEQHNLVAQACNALPVVNRYLAYTRTRGKSTSDKPVPYEPRWPLLKLKALACYESQIVNPGLGCVEHFIGRSLLEYYA
jgi:LmbE family N-acetylglucosaminyl deacetylase